MLLNPEQEEDLIAWIKSHPELYDTHKNEYRKKEVKRELWVTKAQSLNVTYAEIQQWYASQRTRFGKLLKPKSGKATKALTEREQWILQNFEFLRTHIQRQQARAPSSVSTLCNKLLI